MNQQFTDMIATKSHDGECQIIALINSRHLQVDNHLHKEFFAQNLRDGDEKQGSEDGIIGAVEII
jgi:hypothetical protein